MHFTKKSTILAMLSFRKGQEPVSRETTEGSYLSAIGFHSTSKMAAQSYSQGINRENCVGLFRYSDWLSKVGVAKNCETCCVSGRHAKNRLNIKISRHTLVYHYLWNVLAKFHENLSNLHTL